MTLPRPQSVRGGFALIAVLWVTLAAGLLLLGLQKSVRANLAMARNEVESVRARWLARAGVGQAMDVLAQDDRSADGVANAWYDGGRGNVFTEVELTGGWFSVRSPAGAGQDARRGRGGLIDHTGLLNVNLADQVALKALCELTDRQVAGILDWREAEGAAPGPVREGGAKGQYYRNLALPYEFRGGPCQTVGELLLVRDVDPLTFYGEDANGNGLLEAGEDRNGDGQLQLGLAGLTTVYSYEKNVDAAGQKRLNVNTADKETLKKKLGLTDELAEAMSGSGAPEGGDKGGATGAREGRAEGGGRGMSVEGGGPAGPGGPSGAGPVAGGGGGQGTAGGKSGGKYGSLMDLLNVQPRGKPGSSSSSGGKDGTGQITMTWLAEHWDELTVTDEEKLPGRINVNTAPREVLMTLPKMEPGTAEAILRRTSTAGGMFRNVGELLTSGTVTQEQFKAMAPKLTVRGTVFEIRSTGVTRGGARRAITAVVDRAADPMTVLYWCQSQ